AIFDFFFVVIFTITLAIQPSSVPGRFTYNRLRLVFEATLFLRSMVHVIRHFKIWKTLWARMKDVTKIGVFAPKALFCDIIDITLIIRISLLVAHRDHFSLSYSYDLDSAASNVWTETPDLASSLIGWLQFENIFLGLACVLGWWSILYFAKASQTVGELFLAFKFIFMDIITWSALFFIICLAFSGAFFLQMQSSGIDEWSPYWWSMLWMIRITLQEGTFDSFANGANVPAVAILLFIAFSFLMVIVLINLLIAKSADTFQKIHENTRKNWRVDFANLILDIDRVLPKKKLDFFNAHIGFQDLESESGSYLALIEMNADDGQRDMVKAVVGYWDSDYNLDGLPDIEPSFTKSLLDVFLDLFQARRPPDHAEATAEVNGNKNPLAHAEEVELQDISVHLSAGISTSPQTGSAPSNTASDQDRRVDTPESRPTAKAKGNGNKAHRSSGHVAEHVDNPDKMPVEVLINGDYWKDWHRGLRHHMTWSLRRGGWLRYKGDMNIWLDHPHVVKQAPLAARADDDDVVKKFAFPGDTAHSDDGGTRAVPAPDSKPPCMLPFKDLLRLVQIGEVDEVKKWILETDSDGKRRVKEVVENMRGPVQETLLHFAILRNEALANILADYGSPKFLAEDYKNDRFRGETALHLAVVMKRRYVVRQPPNVLVRHSIRI
ncbi:hypothetical protein HK405_006983, partial [Cladochytrium tenue]